MLSYSLCEWNSVVCHCIIFTLFLVVLSLNQAILSPTFLSNLPSHLLTHSFHPPEGDEEVRLPPAFRRGWKFMRGTTVDYIQHTITSALANTLPQVSLNVDVGSCWSDGVLLDSEPYVGGKPCWFMGDGQSAVRPLRFSSCRGA